VDPAAIEHEQTFADWFQSTYSSHIVAHRSAGELGASFFQFKQPAGEFPDQPTSDFVLCLVRSQDYFEADFGAGRFKARFDAALQRPRSKWQEHPALTLAPPGTPTNYWCPNPAEGFVVSIPASTVAQILGAESHLPDFGALHARAFIDPLVEVLVERMWAEVASGSPGGALFIDGAMTTLTATLLGLSKQPSLARPPRGGLAPWQVQRACEYMLAYMHRDVSLAELSALVGLSPFHFARAFKQSLGHPPYAWLTRCRIERAQEIMVRSKLGLAEVALAVGFASQTPFGTAFRKVTGMPPGAWRRARGL
jgi:AraC family transcriptional regulator